MSTKQHIRKALESVSKGNARNLRNHITKAIVEKVRLALAEKEKQISKNFFKESVMLQEDVIDTLKEIVDGDSAKTVKFKDGSSVKVDLQTANVVVTVHSAMKKPDAKKKFEDMMNGSRSQFMKVVDFSWKMVK